MAPVDCAKDQKGKDPIEALWGNVPWVAHGDVLLG